MNIFAVPERRGAYYPPLIILNLYSALRIEGVGQVECFAPRQSRRFAIEGKLGGCGKWYANDNDRIFQNKKYLGTIYQAYLAAEVERLGYEIEPRPHGMFEIKGYQRDNLVEFSKRRMQILAQCPANSTWQTREDSWDRTRKHKEHIPSIELKARWQQETAELGIEIVRSGLPQVDRI